MRADLKNPEDAPTQPPSTESAESQFSYPLPAYLNFVPGGVEYGSLDPSQSQSLPNEKSTAASHECEKPWYLLNSSTCNPDDLVAKARLADSTLRKYTLSYEAKNPTLSPEDESSSQSMPYRLPSLSVLAEASFAPLTGVSASSAKKWADSMILGYLDDNEDDIVEGNDEYIRGMDDVQLQREYQDKVKSLETKSSSSFKQPVSTTTSNAPPRDLPTVLKELHQQHLDKVAKNASVDPNAPMCIPVRPCGYIFRRGDIAWNCRTCQTDPTCVLCDKCFRESDHTGHEVTFHRTSPGGCCDCGDAEAWRVEGCCPRHRPRTNTFAADAGEAKSGSDNTMTGGSADGNDADYEAVKAATRGRADGETFVKDMLPQRFAAALGVVIGSAVNTILRATDGAGVGADSVQWTRRWADQIRRIHDGRSIEEEYALSTKISCASSVGEAMKLKLPNRFKLSLRLHNDDVHTFDEVIDALYNQGRGTEDVSIHSSLVKSRNDATELTHHVDSDGQVIARSYNTIEGAKAGFDRLKSRGLHCAVVSTPQVDLELRARLLLSWLSDISAAHPAVSALVVHALVDVTEGIDCFGGAHVWGNARLLPPWSFSPGYLSTLNVDWRHQVPGWRQRMDVFPPNLKSSYLTREEGMQLHQLGFSNPDDASSPIIRPGEFVEHRGADPNFYSKALYLLPSERFRKSPHALWGTMPPPFATGKKCDHPILYRQNNGNRNMHNLVDRLLVLDTDLRKQQQPDVLTTDGFPHKLLGLHMISGVGLSDVEGDENGGSSMAPTTEDWRLLLSVSSYRAPVSPILLFLLLDPYPPKQLRLNLHSLFLSLIIDSRFKSRFAASLGAVAYRSLSTLFCAGVGTSADTILGFTVQTFTVGSLVRALGNGDTTRQLLAYDSDKKDISYLDFQDVFTLPLAQNIVRCIHTNLLGATKEITMVLKNTAPGSRSNGGIGNFDNTRNSSLAALTYHNGELPLTTLLPAAPDDGFLESRSMKHKRLPHLLRDLEYIFETPGTALRLLLSSPSPTPTRGSVIGKSDTNDPSSPLSFPVLWCRLLRLSQGMDPQKRKTSGPHVEYEQQRWLEAFSLTLNFSQTRDALVENHSHSGPNSEPPGLELVRQGMGNLFEGLLREIKSWLFKEGIWETGFLVVRGPNDTLGHTGQMEALQRSTLHVSSPSSSDKAPIALSCANYIKMTEGHLDAIESALKVEQSKHHLNGSGRGTIMGDWLRVPHSPHAGSYLSFHLPLHRCFARNVRSMCLMIVPESARDSEPMDWWKLPVVDEVSGVKSDVEEELLEHPMSTLLRPALRTSNCRITWSSGPDCNSEEAQLRRSRSRTISAAIASAKVTHSMCDHPLRCLAAAEQIMRHLWVRNGSTASSMSVNYTNVPLCTNFRDLDFTMVQLSAAGMSIGLGARRVFSLILSRFNMDGYLCDPEKRNGSRSPSSASTTSFGGTGWSKPQRLQDPDHALPLAEALFSTICVLVTELPSPPPVSHSDDMSLRMHVRRELLHALAAEPRSYSEAMSAASTVFSRREEHEDSTNGDKNGPSSLRDLVSEVLRDIGKQKTQGARSTEAPSFELKAETSDEYDPSFFHLRREQHQQAMDNVAILRKQKLTGRKKDNKQCLPIVCAPPAGHPRFIPCRLILHLSALDAAARRALLLAVTGGQWFPPNEPTDNNEMGLESSSFSSELNSRSMKGPAGARRSYTRSQASIKKSMSLPGEFADSTPFSPEVVNASSCSILEVLQILTLQVHTLEECAYLQMSHPSLDHENKSISVGLSINSYLDRMINVPSTLTDIWCLRPYPEGPLPSSGNGANRGSILGLLLVLYEHRADNGKNANTDARGSENDIGGARFLVANGLKWLLRFIESLIAGAHSVKEACESATSGVPIQSTDKVKENHGTSWTIDPHLKRTIGDMMMNLPNLWQKDDEEEANKEEDEMTSKNREARKAAQMRVLEKMKNQQNKFAKNFSAEIDSTAKNGKADTESELCIICRCDDNDGENNGPLGYLGHVQRSRTLQLRSCSEALHRKEDVSLTYRVVGDKGCQIRSSESMDSVPIACIPVGSLVKVKDPQVSDNYDLLSRRVFVTHCSSDRKVTEGWASVQSAQGYVILSPVVSMCHSNTRWGSSRPMIKLCGHAAHLSCVETHVASIHQKAQSETAFDGRFAADIDDGEFLCPLCKQLSNIVVPAETCIVATKPIPSDTKPATKTSDEMISDLQAMLATRPRTGPTDVAKRKSVEQYGTYLYEAMRVFLWDTNKWKKYLRSKKWHPSIEKWDFEEDDDQVTEMLSSEEQRDPSIKKILRLLRQQHIAWATVGHNAAIAEASTRAVRTQGFEPSTTDPWADYDNSSRDSHPMLIELRRTLSAAASFYSNLCTEIDKTLSDGMSSTSSITGTALSNILVGKFWATEEKNNGKDTNESNVAQWNALTALLSSLPCHTASDGTLSIRHEARATATAFWAIKGHSLRQQNTALNQVNSGEVADPPMPLSVRQIPSSTTILQNDWGTLNPSDTSGVPFRPFIASGFLYIPLLSWDLNSLAGAIFSTILSTEQPDAQSLKSAAQTLLVGRIVQVLITPQGLNTNTSMGVDELECNLDVDKDGAAILELMKKCQSEINKNLKAPSLNGGELLVSVSSSILPFARSLILLLRASISAVREMTGASSTDTTLEKFLESDETMYIEDGFYVLQELGGPMPSTIMGSWQSNAGGNTWGKLIQRWLQAALALDSYHGSKGNHLEFDAAEQKWTKAESSNANDDTFVSGNGSAQKMSTSASEEGAVSMDYASAPSGVDINDDDSWTEVVEGNGDANMTDGAESHDTPPSDDDEIMDDGSDDDSEVLSRIMRIDDDDDSEGDEAELDPDDDIMDDLDIPMIHSQRSQVDNGTSSDDEASDDDVSTYSWDRTSAVGSSEKKDNFFAGASRSVIIPFQSSFLGNQEPGPGPRGKKLDYRIASSIMNDASHLGMMHSCDSLEGSGLIRLPQSFVELYGIVNRVKMNGKSNSIDDTDDSSGGETAICLLTGTIMRSGSSRRTYSARHRPPGTCTKHARKIGSGTGIFFLLQKCTVLLVHNKKSAYSASLYVDENGEEDTGLTRGRPLFLKEDRYATLENLWRQHGIPREVARIRSTSDRVIRENWY